MNHEPVFSRQAFTQKKRLDPVNATINPIETQVIHTSLPVNAGQTVLCGVFGVKRGWIHRGQHGEQHPHADRRVLSRAAPSRRCPQPN